MFSRIVLALALLASSPTAFQANFPKLGGAKASKKIEVPEEEKPLTERLGGVGVTAPFNEGFDPFGFASRADAAQMIKFREAELKHGRVAMLAVPGFLLSEQFHPILNFVDKVENKNIPKWEVGVFASQDTWEQPEFRGILAVSLAAIFVFESKSFEGWSKPDVNTPEGKNNFFQMKEDYVPGSWAAKGPWTLANIGAEKFLAKQNAELNNGRLAMISILLIVLQELVFKEPVDFMDEELFLKGLSM